MSVSDGYIVKFAQHGFVVQLSTNSKPNTMKRLVPAVCPPVSAWTQKLEPKSDDFECRTETVYVKPRPEPETKNVKPKPKGKKHRRKIRKKSTSNPQASSNNPAAAKNEVDQFWYWPMWPDTSGQDPDSIAQSDSSSPLSPYDDSSFKLLQPWSPSFLPKKEPKSVLSGSQIAKLVEDQLAYYFCRDNLLKDVHLRRMFDPGDGTVALAELIKFSKLKNLLGKDVECLVKIVRMCDFVELFEDAEDIRKSRIRIPDWKFWALKAEGF